MMSSHGRGRGVLSLLVLLAFVCCFCHLEGVEVFVPIQGSGCSAAKKGGPTREVVAAKQFDNSKDNLLAYADAPGKRVTLTTTSYITSSTVSISAR